MLPTFFKPNLEPFKHQLELLEISWKKKYFAFLMEMGTGKTKALLDTFCLLFESQEVDGLVVFAPKGVYSNWTKPGGEIENHMWNHLKPEMVVARWRSGGIKSGAEEMRRLLSDKPPGPRIFVVNIEALSTNTGALAALRAFCKKFKTLVVVDESSKIGNHTSERTKRIKEVGDWSFYRRIMTGSVSKGSPTTTYSQFDFLQKGCLGYRNITTFKARYTLQKDIEIQNGRTVKIECGVQNLDELAESVSKHSYKKYKDECFDMPPKIYQPREVEITAEQKLAYHEMKRHSNTTISGDVSASAKLFITRLQRMHTILCGHLKADDGTVHRIKNNRIDALMETIEESGSEKIIIWCNYQPDISEVLKALRKDYQEHQISQWHGQIPERLRESGEDEFKNGPARFMLATPQAGGHGRQWHVASTVIYYSNSHDLELREQSEDRAHRYGVQHPVTYVDLVIPGTLDEDIIQALRNKKDIVAQIMARKPGEWF